MLRNAGGIYSRDVNSWHVFLELLILSTVQTLKFSLMKCVVIGTF